MGLDLVLSGAMDRVDINKKDPNLFRIIDYKTGSKDNFDKKLRLEEEGYDYSKTKKLQYYIYKKVLENILKSREDIYPNPRVAKFTYIFEGEGDQSLIDLNFDEEFIEVIESRIKELLDLNILEEDENTVYDPKDNSLSCRYCEFDSICMVDKGVNIDE